MVCIHEHLSSYLFSLSPPPSSLTVTLHSVPGNVIPASLNVPQGVFSLLQAAPCLTPNGAEALGFYSGGCCSKLPLEQLDPPAELLRPRSVCFVSSPWRPSLFMCRAVSIWCANQSGVSVADLHLFTFYCCCDTRLQELWEFFLLLPPHAAFQFIKGSEELCGHRRPKVQEASAHMQS